MHDLEGVVQYAVNAMGDTPRPFASAISRMCEIREVTAPTESSDWLAEFVQLAVSNNATAHAIGLALRSWDRIEKIEWIGNTPPLTDGRRLRIYQLLKVSNPLRKQLDLRFPVFSPSEIPLVIAENHKRWYFEDRRRNRYYWDSYRDYLRVKRSLSADDIAQLDEATDDVVARISDPTQIASFQTKGLVIGYVQSGKTTHFTGVVSKAADAGYRLIIVLAGTMDILRQQTQRRIDKELIGREFVEDEYINDKDWKDFISHGEKPSVLGHYDWQRLTNSEEDYQALRQGIAALEFRLAHRDKPFFDPANLFTAEARLIVIKKNPRVIQRLVNDLYRIRSKLTQVPCLIVDDESDQASINTIDPHNIRDRTRTETNRVIVELLKTLPRSQYIGYTATPFANALINADDAEDLFPREFMIGLPRPKGYMGVADFYDDLPVPVGFKSNQRAFVRDVRGDDEIPENLLRAIDMFILAGAIKVFREHSNPAAFEFEHHTMLIHHSPYREVHEEQARQVRAIFEGGAYHSSKGAARLERLFDSDFSPVSKAQEPRFPTPRGFDDLKPFIGECLRRVGAGKAVRIVNGDNKDDTPNFEKGPVWAILIGGAKLSRGYTIEGLTITYYRRVATAADTLMQMGRWFGFRPGYRDLVRLFIGRREPIGRSGRKTLDLYEAFDALCQDEEEFRRDLRKYERDGLKPIQVPPLVPSHLSALTPTARNKMYNAEIVFRNFGASRIERTVAPTKRSDALENQRLAKQLLSQCTWAAESFSYRDNSGEMVEINALCGSASPSAVLTFLSGYLWESGAHVLEHEIDFLKGAHGDPEIDRWTILAPLTKQRVELWPKGDSQFPAIPVRTRNRIGRRFKVFTEPDHVSLAEYLSNIDKGAINSISKSIGRWTKPRSAVMLFYPVRDETEEFVTIAFALHFPPNHLEKRLSWTVRRAGEHGDVPVVVDADGHNGKTSPRGPSKRSRARKK